MIRSVSRSLAILEKIYTSSPESVLKLSQDLCYSYSSTFRLVRNLERLGYIKIDENNKRYTQTDLAGGLSSGFDKDHSVSRSTRSVILEMSNETGWPLILSRNTGESVEVLESSYQYTEMRFSEYFPGDKVPMLYCSAGHVFLANIDKVGLSCIYKGLVFKYGESELIKSVFDSDYLNTVRKQGYATTDRLFNSKNPGLTSSVSVPLIISNSLNYQLTMSFISSSMTVDEAVKKYLSVLKTCVNKIKLTI